MSPLAVSAIAIEARTAVLRIAEPRARFFLADSRAFCLSDGGRARAGTTDRVVTVLSDLLPATDYVFKAEGCLPFAFRTADCAGLVSAADHARPRKPATAALQAAIDRVPAGGTLFLPAGEWWTGPLFLRGDMTLHLAAGARLMALGDRSQFPILEARQNGRVLGSWEGEPARSFAALLTAVGCRRLRITGTGVIDGGGDRGDWWQWPKTTRDDARRARTLHLVDCEDVVLAGPTIRNSPSWTVHPYGCRRLLAAGLTIENPPDSPNTDGFDPESCEDLTIEGVRISVGDDCIAIKAGKRGTGDNTHLAPTRGVTVRHCLMERGHGGVVLGSEMSGGIEDVTVEDCEMYRTDRGLRLKTRRGRGGAVRRIAFRRVVMNGVETAVAVNAFYFCDADGHDGWVQSRAPAVVDETTPEISDIEIDELDLSGLRLAVGVFLGLPEAPLKRIRVGRVKAAFDPDAIPAIPEMADALRPLRGEGIVAEHADVSVGGGDLTITQGVSSVC
jgi:polygalacturonase